MKLSQAKLLVKAIPGLQTQAERFKDENAVTCTVTKDGHIWDNHNHSCYAGLSDRDVPKEEALAVISRIFLRGWSWYKSKYKCTREELLHYIDYIINRSPWNNAFISKDAKSVLKHKIIITDVTQPANYMVAAMISTRYCHEYPHWVHMWNLLVKNGVNEDYAWLLIHCTNFDPVKNGPFYFINTGNGHAAVCNKVPYSTVKNFINRTMTGPNKPYNTGASYYGFDDLWYKASRYQQEDITSRLNELAKNYTSNAGVKNNPFTKSLKNNNGNSTPLTLDQMIKVIVDTEKLILEEVNNVK